MIHKAIIRDGMNQKWNDAGEENFKCLIKPDCTKHDADGCTCSYKSHKQNNELATAGKVGLSVVFSRRCYFPGRAVANVGLGAAHLMT